MNRNSAARARRQRDRRIALGWKEVKVWVPSQADAEVLQALAADMRSKVAPAKTTD